MSRPKSLVDLRKKGYEEDTTFYFLGSGPLIDIDLCASLMMLTRVGRLPVSRIFPQLCIKSNVYTLYGEARLQEPCRWVYHAMDLVPVVASGFIPYGHVEPTIELNNISCELLKNNGLALGIRSNDNSLCVMGIVATCERCGGDGKTSWNLHDFTLCPECLGRRWQLSEEDIRQQSTYLYSIAATLGVNLCK